jgi:hypothetical protein
LEKISENELIQEIKLDITENYIGVLTNKNNIHILDCAYLIEN